LTYLNILSCFQSSLSLLQFSDFSVFISLGCQPLSVTVLCLSGMLSGFLLLLVLLLQLFLLYESIKLHVRSLYTEVLYSCSHVQRLTHYPRILSFWRSLLAHSHTILPATLRFSASILHISALAATLYTFVILTT